MLNSVTNIVVIFLAAIVAANLIISHFGQWALPITALFLIPLDLVVRDVLHERWKGKGLVVKMFVLIFVGSALTAILNHNAINIALASCIAFFSASTINYITYSLLYSKARLIKMNVSNTLAAITDSLVFPAIAFSTFNMALSTTQSLTKILGGVSIVYIYNRYKEDRYQ